MNSTQFHQIIGNSTYIFNITTITNTLTITGENTNEYYKWSTILTETHDDKIFDNNSLFKIFNDFTNDNLNNLININFNISDSGSCIIIEIIMSMPHNNNINYNKSITLDSVFVSENDIIKKKLTSMEQQIINFKNENSVNVEQISYLRNQNLLLCDRIKILEDYHELMIREKTEKHILKKNKYNETEDMIIFNDVKKWQTNGIRHQLTTGIINKCTINHTIKNIIILDNDKIKLIYVDIETQKILYIKKSSSSNIFVGNDDNLLGNSKFNDCNELLRYIIMKLPDMNINNDYSGTFIMSVFDAITEKSDNCPLVLKQKYDSNSRYAKFINELINKSTNLLFNDLIALKKLIYDLRPGNRRSYVEEFSPNGPGGRSEMRTVCQFLSAHNCKNEKYTEIIKNSGKTFDKDLIDYLILCQ